MQDLIAKADTLLEALPYIQKFSGATFVIKYGGSFMDSPDPAVRNGVARDIVFLEAADINPVIVHGGGNVFVRTLGPGESILVKPTAILFKDSSVQMQLHMETPKSTFSLFGFWALRYMWLKLSGPGRVAVQSAFEPVEDDGRAITNTSPITQSRW